MVPRDSFVKGCSNISSFPPLSRFLALFRSTVRALMTLSHSSSSWLISSRELPNPVMINLQAMVVRFWWNIISHFITCLLFFHFQRIYWIVLWTHFQIDKVRQTGHRFDPRFNSLVARTDVFFIYSKFLPHLHLESLSEGSPSFIKLVTKNLHRQSGGNQLIN